MSMSGGWFFVVASEAIVGRRHDDQIAGHRLLSRPRHRGKAHRCGVRAIVAMLAVIIAYDQLLFRPLVAFGARFRVELRPVRPRRSPWSRNVFARTHWMRAVDARSGRAVPCHRAAAHGIADRSCRACVTKPALSRVIDILWVGACIGLATIWAGWLIVELRAPENSLERCRAKRSLHDLPWCASSCYGARDAGLGAGRRLDRSAAGGRRKSAAPGAIPGGVSGECRVSGRRRSYSEVLSQPRHLAEFSDHLRHAMVHSFQRDRWRFGVSQRSQGGGGEFSHSRLGLVEERYYSRRSFPIT